MSVHRLGVVGLLSILMAGCGGSSGSESGASYSFVTPKLNSEAIYAYTIVDNSNNTINQIVRDTITAVNADGSYVFVHDDPVHDSITVNGATYSTLTESITVNSSGQHLSYSFASASGVLTPCTVTPHGAGPTYPITIGQSWALSYSITCGAFTTTTYLDAGTVAGVESVVVPQGTFMAVKLQSILSWTDPNGTVRTEAITTWRDVTTEVVVKRTIDIQYSGTALVTGHPVSTTLVLQSQS